MLPNPPENWLYQSHALLAPATCDRRASARSNRSHTALGGWRKLTQAVQDVTGHTVKLAFVDQGYTSDVPAQEAQEQGMQLEVIKLPHAKRGFVLLPRRWLATMSAGP